MPRSEINMPRTVIGSTVGNALSFAGNNGSNRVAITTDVSQRGMSQIFFSAWIYPIAGSTNRRFIYLTNTADNNKHFDLYLQGTSGILIFESQYSDGNVVWFGPAPTENVWSHIIVGYNNSAPGNTPVLYVNGVSQSFSLNTGRAGTATHTDELLYLGNLHAANRAYNGYLDEIRFYNRLPTANDVSALFAKQNLLDGNRGIWRFDDLSGGTTPDTSGRSARGTITGAIRVDGTVNSYRNAVI